ncbi:MAG TPA: transporter [Vicinamibacterales bacterium]|nr:transporter [Vicinamibacterales bacterium]
MRVSIVVTVVTLLASASPAHAQDPYNVTVNVTELSRIFTELYGPDGLVVNSLASLAGGVSHSAHFNSGFESEFSQFGTALTGQIVSLPLPAPASGFTYQFDSGLGVFTRSTSSFGPILAERADTIGARRVSIGFAYQRLAFDSIENIDLQSVPAVFTHDNAELRGGREDVITTVNSIDSEVSRSAAFITYGVTNDLDVSIAVPYITTDIVVTSDATVRRIGTTIPEIHFFRAVDDSIGDRRIYTAFGHASGIGDITIRMKQAIKKSPKNGIALGIDLRLPTGDENNLLGTGAPAVQPFAAWSATYGTFAPHINLGYQWNGSSTLAGDIEAGVSEDLPDVAVYALGAVVAVHPRVTLALDVLGRYIIDSPRVHLEDFVALDGHSVYPNIAFDTGSINELSSAVGLKINVAGRLLLNTNLLMRLNSGGLRDKISPLVGVEYAF